MKLEQIISALQARKGHGLWHKIAKESGVHYDTVARIARGSIVSPGIQTVERLTDALRVVKAPKD